MILKQIQRALEKSERFSAIIRTEGGKLMLSTKNGLDGIYTTISIHGRSDCLLMHPVVLYETAEQATSFLHECCGTAIEDQGIEFYDDPIAKCIMATKTCKTTFRLWLLFNIDDTVIDFVNSVESIRETLSTVVWDTISPICINSPERSLFYLSLMYSYNCPWDWCTDKDAAWFYKIDLIDIRKVWEKSKSVFFLPLIKGDILNSLTNYIDGFLAGAKGYIVAYFGLPYWANEISDTRDLDKTIKEIQSKYGCTILNKTKITSRFGAPKQIALVAILKQ